MDNERILEKLDYIITLLQKTRHKTTELTEIFFENKRPDDFVDLSTKKAYEIYQEFILSANVEETPVSLRTFNSIVKDKFPTLKIAHTTRNKKQLYIWR